MKIMILTGGYIPAKNYGGPVLSLQGMCNAIGDRIQIYVLTNDHDLKSRKRLDGINPGWNTVGYAKVFYLRDHGIWLPTMKRIIKEVMPDLIYVNSLFYAKMMIPAKILNLNMDIPVILAPRGELYRNQMRIKFSKKIAYLWLFRYIMTLGNFYFHSTSDEETKQIQRYFLNSKSRVFQVTNIPAIPHINVDKSEKKSGLSRLVFLARISREKNLLFALQALHGVRGDVTYDIYGNIEDQGYWEQCLAEIRRLPKNVSVRYLGVCDRERISDVLSSHDFLLFPTFSENYGHSIVESMLCGCPVIISPETPWKDLQCNNAGWVLSLNDRSGWKRVIEQTVQMTSEEYNQLSKNAREYIRKKVQVNKLGQEYITMFSDAIQQRTSSFPNQSL